MLTFSSFCTLIGKKAQKNTIIAGNKALFPGLIDDYYGSR